jgi:hypothetical protein
MRIQSYYFSKLSDGSKIGHHPYRLHFENQEIRLVLMEFCRNNYGPRYDYRRWDDWKILRELFRKNIEPIVENTNLNEEKLEELYDAFRRDGNKVKDEYKRMRRLEKKGHRYSTEGRYTQEKVEEIKKDIREWEKGREDQIERLLQAIGLIEDCSPQHEDIDEEVIGRSQEPDHKKSKHVADRINALEEKIYGKTDGGDR